MEFPTIKQKVQIAYDSYKRNFPDEYQTFLKEQARRRDGLKDEKFAEIKGTDISLRQILEYPETLSMLIRQTFSDDEEIQWKEFTVQKWFAETYPEFKIPKKI